ncbi:MAG: hypothetical protein GX189_02900 [Clostridiales bacterium]|nr:hypothetical protein [Clostridiales bacterium]
MRRRTRSRRKICPAKSRRGEKTPTAQTKLKTKTPARFAGRVRAFLRHFLFFERRAGFRRAFYANRGAVFWTKTKNQQKRQAFLLIYA